MKLIEIASACLQLGAPTAGPACADRADTPSDDEVVTGSRQRQPYWRED